MPRLRLRRFLYLDEKLTNEFLSQVGIDIYDEEAQTKTSELTRKRGAGLQAGPDDGARALGPARRPGYYVRGAD